MASLTTQGLLRSAVLDYTIRLRSNMRIDGERMVVDLGSASNYVASHIKLS